MVSACGEGPPPQRCKAKLTKITTAASDIPTRASGWIVRATPTRPTAIRRAAMSPRHRVNSTRERRSRGGGEQGQRSDRGDSDDGGRGGGEPVTNARPIRTMPRRR